MTAEQSGEDHGFSFIELGRNGLCFVIVKEIIPRKLETARLARLVIEDRLEAEGLKGEIDSNIFVVKDDITDGIASHRIRLVPQEVSAPNDLKGIGRVKELIVNIPEPFVEDEENADGFEAVLVALKSGEGNMEVVKKYLIFPTGVVPYDHFKQLALGFTHTDGEFDELTEVRVNPEVPQLSLQEQYDIANGVANLLRHYKLARQSRKDGTIR